MRQTYQRCNVRASGIRICVILALCLAGSVARAQTAGATAGLEVPQQSAPADMSGIPADHTAPVGGVQPQTDLRSLAVDGSSTGHESGGNGIMSVTSDPTTIVGQPELPGSGSESGSRTSATGRRDAYAAAARPDGADSAATSAPAAAHPAGRDPLVNLGIAAVVVIMGGTMAVIAILGRERPGKNGRRRRFNG